MPKRNIILSGALRLFSHANAAIARLAGVGAAEFDADDYAILQVAMMVTALDGDVRDDELAAFDRLAKKCSGYSPESAETALQRGLRSAGYLALQAKRLKAKDLVAAFVREALAALPEDFLRGSLFRVRQAFVMWLSMALSDGDYSNVERQALEALRAECEAEIRRFDSDNQKRWRTLSPACAVSAAAAHKSFAVRDPPSKAFLAKAESLLNRLNQSDATAERQLKALILTNNLSDEFT